MTIEESLELIKYRGAGTKDALGRGIVSADPKICVQINTLNDSVDLLAAIVERVVQYLDARDDELRVDLLKVRS